MDDDKIQPWDSDHTALVHVVWAAERQGLSVSDADALASHIMRSKWMRAVRMHAVERASISTSEPQQPGKGETR